MTERFDIGDMELPDDLRALDEELSSITYEERASFGPELRAELASAWAEEPPRGRFAVRRHLAAAALAGLLVVGASVPSARASFVRLIRAFGSETIEVVAPSVGPVRTEPSMEGESEAAPPTEEPAVVVSEPEPERILDVVSEPVIALPQMMDRERAERLLQDAYPMYLQRRGVGGTVWLRLWVEDTGIVGFPSVLRTSGVPALDRVAADVASDFTFSPALQDGRRMGTWIEFPVVFEPDPSQIERVLNPVVDPFSLPTIDRSEWWELREPLDLAALPAVNAPAGEKDEARMAAERSLAAALQDPALIDELGPLEAILSGEAPGGMAPTRWRATVGSALEYSRDQGMENPASLLSLGRIRLRQGLHTEARSLFERGLRMAVLDESEASAWVLAELHHERGTLVRASWLASDGIGRVRAQAFGAGQCVQARSAGGAEEGFASSERLIAWNYLCPVELGTVFNEGFESLHAGSPGDLTLMMASFRAALEAYPAHVEANIDLLITLASEERWESVLSGARRFTRVTQGDPTGLLLAGLALHRLDRSAEAAEHFEAALARLPEADAEALTDVGFLVGGSRAAEYERLPAAERRVWEDNFWKTKDQSPSTLVNERRVEHLARAAYARLRFGSVFGDVGEVWVRFGRPNSIHIVDEGSGRLTEFWDYGSGPDITFVRWVASKRTDLTPEGRAYIDDLGKIFPPQ